jgi:hypothetical protein
MLKVKCSRMCRLTLKIRAVSSRPAFFMRQSTKTSCLNFTAVWPDSILFSGQSVAARKNSIITYIRFRTRKRTVFKPDALIFRTYFLHATRGSVTRTSWPSANSSHVRKLKNSPTCDFDDLLRNFFSPVRLYRNTAVSIPTVSIKSPFRKPQ